MTTATAQAQSHEERMRAFEESLQALVKAFHQLREDMAAGESNPTDHDDTRSS
ncbi:hypothetical protein LNN38_21240 [Pseudomonas sp. LA21]|uniref:hypothetical protein n=1 Tax=Pseudomonas sp. LA21 TaxID=2893373 RepID=UPI001FB798E1|nr:hypothetical protein [Pseudomonas sp. LA21]MCJ1887399.1 hypothetical protein [Pseudomonas sp. LA21]